MNLINLREAEDRMWTAARAASLTLRAAHSAATTTGRPCPVLVSAAREAEKIFYAAEAEYTAEILRLAPATAVAAD